MPDKNKYLHQIITYLSNLTTQRSMLYVAISGVSICLILVVLGIIFPKGLPTDDPTGSDNPDKIVESYAGITSEYTANQAIDFVKSAIYTDEIDNPSCSTDQAEFTAFFSHRKYWKVSLLCPPEPANGIHYSKEYLYEFNEWDKTVKDTSVN
ncbi:MAG: hypothetical protein CL886_06835 [Dehalococcoidia bacterium]|nr:hypothetical protein [Dehalococcoidia bacterium]|tara:strand:- start:320 stop:775 length:456 start_codon:yes stop_codon:yes gene_type:complete